MKQITLVLFTALITLISYGQHKKDLIISVAAGALTSPYYLENKGGSFYTVDFDYHLSKRRLLSVNYNGGEHSYYDNILSTDPGYIKSDGTNAKAIYHTFSVLYKYMFLDKNAVSGSIGSGVGIMTHSREYPYAISNGSIFVKTAWTDLVFPVRAEFDFKVSKCIRMGVIGGFYIAPDYPILAYYVGPRLGYLLK
jgi:hypothetical protein